MPFVLNTLFFFIAAMGIGLKLSAQGDILAATRNKDIIEGKIIRLSSGTIEAMPDFSSPHPMTVTSATLFNNERGLILYSNGCYVFNANHMPIHEHSLQKDSDIEQFCDVGGSVNPNSTLFIPTPSSEEHAYLIYQKGDHNYNKPSADKQLMLLTIDTKNEDIFNSVPIPLNNPGQFDVALHDNGEDYWLAVLNQENFSIVVFLINNDGVNYHSEFPIIVFQNELKCTSGINIRFSKNKDKLLINAANCFLSVCSFDACEGRLFDLKVNVHTQTYTIGGEASFSDDGKLIVLHREWYYETSITSANLSEILVFRTEKIGSSVIPEAKILAPHNYSMGRILSSEEGIYIFNRFSDSKFIYLRIVSMDPLTIETSLEESSFWYYPSFSKNIPKNNSINKCINSTSENFLSHKYQILPNPASSEILIYKQESEYRSENYPIKVSTINSNGQRIKEYILKGTSSSLDVSSLSSGLYFFEFVDSIGNRFLEKILIAR